MRKDQGFDMLDNADEKTIERLSEVPVLTADEKERILKMSKDKLNRRYRENNIEEDIITVERYNRPKWQTFAAVAASLMLVCGIAGTGLLMKRGGVTPDNQSSQSMQDPKCPVKTAVSTATATGTSKAAETATGTKPAAKTTETTAASQEKTLPQQVIALFDQLHKLNMICGGGGVAIDVDDSISFDFDGETYNYSCVVDDRFSTVDEAWAYFSETAAGVLLRENYYACFHDNFSPAIFRESDGKLYFRDRNPAVSGAIITDMSEPVISNQTDDSFDFSFTAKVNGIGHTINGDALREDNKWKINNYSFDVVPRTTENQPAEADNESESSDNTAPTSDDSGNVKSREESFIDECKKEAKLRWDEIASENNGDASIEYTLYDMDGDGEREFFLKYGTCEADFRINGYTYKQGYLENIGVFSGSHSMFNYDTITGEFVLAWGHMGHGAYQWYELKNGTVNITRSENVDYSIIGFENIKGYENVHALPSYGAGVYIDGTIYSYASENGDYRTVDGFDLSFLK